MPTLKEKEIKATEVKSHFSSIIQEVATQGVTYTVLRYNTPSVRITPINTPKTPAHTARGILHRETTEAQRNAEKKAWSKATCAKEHTRQSSANNLRQITNTKNCKETIIKAHATKRLNNT